MDPILPKRGKDQLKAILFLRGVVALGIAMLGYEFVRGWATSGWGFSAGVVSRELLVMLLLLFPVCMIPFIGCRWRTILLGAFAVFLLAFAPGQYFARAQEYQVLQIYGPAPDRDLFISRWAPYSHHTIAYYQGKGWTGWD